MSFIETEPLEKTDLDNLKEFLEYSQNNKGIELNVESYKKWATEVKGLGKVFDFAKIKASALKVATTGLNVGLNMLAGAIASLIAQGIIKLLDELIVTQEEASEKTKKAIEEYKQTESEIESINSQIEETNKKIDELNSKDSLTLIEQDELDLLYETNSELARQLALKEALEKKEKKDANEAAVESLSKKSNKSIEYNPDDTSNKEVDRITAVEERLKQIERLNSDIDKLEERQSKLSPDSAEYKQISTQLNGSGMLVGLKEALEEYNSEVSEMLTEIQEESAGLQEGMPGADELLKRIKTVEDSFIILSGEQRSANESIFNNIFDTTELKDIKKDLELLASSGELTIESFDTIGKVGNVSFSKIADSIKNADWVLKEGQDPLQVFIDLLKIAGETGTNAIGGKNITSLSTMIDEVSNKTSSLAQAQSEMSNSGVLSLSTVKSLIENFPELENRIKSTSDGYILEEGAIQGCVNALVQKYEIEAQSNLDALLADLGLEQEAYGKTTDEIRNLIKAKYKLFTLNSVGMNFDEFEKQSRKYKDALNSLDEKDNATALKENINNEVFNGGRTAKETAEDNANALKTYNKAIEDNAKKLSDAEKQYSDTAKEAQEKIADAHETYNKAVEESKEKTRDAYDDYNEKISDIQESLEELDKEEHLANLKYDIETVTNSLNEFSQAIDRLNDKLDLSYESDYTYKLQAIKDQFITASDYSGEMEAELERLLSINPESADEAEELASRLESLSSDFFENEKSIIEYQNTLISTKAEFLTEIGENAVSSLSQAKDILDNTFSSLENGSFIGGMWSQRLLPTVSKDAVKKQREQNDKLLAEEQRYQEAIAEIRKQAADMAKTEDDSEREKQREEYQQQMVEAKQELDETLAEIQQSLSDAKETLTSTLAEVDQTMADAHNTLLETVTGIESSLNDSFTSYNESVNGAVEATKKAIDDIANYAGSKKVSFTVQSFVDKIEGENVVHKANGGYVNGTAIVNERGQESVILPDGTFKLISKGEKTIANFPKGSRILNAKDTAEILNTTATKDGDKIPHFENGSVSLKHITKTEKSLSNSPADLFVGNIIEDINDAFESLKSNVSVEPVKEHIYSELNDTSFYKNIDDGMSDNIRSLNESPETYINAIALENSSWEQLPENIQAYVEEMKVSKDSWNAWILQPENMLKAMELLKESGNGSWDLLSPSVVSILNQMGIDGKNTWDNFVKNNPLQALQLLTSSWQALHDSIKVWIDDCISIASNGAKAIHDIKIEAPQISVDSWNNLQTLIANKIQEVLNVINETFGNNTVDLNFSINTSLPGNSATNPQGVGKGSDISSTASKYTGVPYVWGGESTSGWDCSGFVINVFGQHGITIPERTTQSQWASDTGVRITDQSQLQPGDCLYFANSSGDVHHVAIYEGNGMMVHAKGRNYGTVEESFKDSSYYQSEFIGAKRYYANGTSNANNEDALVGDEHLLTGVNHPTPELIFRKETNEAFLAGLNGAETVKLKKGDVVVPYAQTKKILNKKGFKHNSIKAYPTGKGEWLGYISTAFEVGGQEPKPSNWLPGYCEPDDGAGNPSFGMPQFPQGNGHNNAANFIDKYLNKLASDGLKKIFENTTPGWNDAFVSAWRKAGEEYSEEFGSLQLYAAYKQDVEYVVKQLGSAFANRSRAIQEAIYATAIHYGPGGFMSRWNARGLNSSMSDAEIVAAICDIERKGGFARRADIEYEALMKYVNANAPALGRLEDIASYSPNGAIIGQISSKINELFKRLQDIVGTFKTNTNTVMSKVSPIRSLGSNRQNKYDFDTPFTTRAEGGIVGDEYTIYNDGTGDLAGQEAYISGNKIIPLSGGTGIAKFPKGTPILNAKQYKTIKDYVGNRPVIKRMAEGNTDVTVEKELISDDEEVNNILREIKDLIKDGNDKEASERLKSLEETYTISDNTKSILDTTKTSLKTLIDKRDDYIYDINKYLTDGELTSDTSYTANELETILSGMKKLDEGETVSINNLDSLLDFEKNFDEVFDMDKIEDKLNDITSDYNKEAFENERRYKEEQKTFKSGFGSWAKESDSVKQIKRYTESLDSAVKMQGREVFAQSALTLEATQKGIDLILESLDSAYQLLDTAETASQQQEVIAGISSLNEQLSRLNDNMIGIWDSMTEHILSLVKNDDLKYTSAETWLDKSISSIDEKLENSTDGSERYTLTKEKNIALEKKAQLEKDRQGKAHQNVLDYIYNISPEDEFYEQKKYITDNYKLDEMFDANGEYNDMYQNTLDALRASGDESLVAVFQQMAELMKTEKQIYYEAEENLQDIAKNIKENNDSIKTDKLQAYLDLQGRLIEILDVRSKKENAVINAKQTQYDLMQSLRDTQSQMTEELRANKELSQYLDADTRRLLFNEDDYAELSDEINGINSEAEKLFNNYQDEINSLSENEYYKEEQLTAEYERQSAVLTEQLENAKQRLNIAKKQTEYDNTAKERDTQVIMGNRKVNIADPEKMHSLATELASMENEYENTQITNAENEDIRNMQRLNDITNEESAALQARVNMWNEMTEEEQLKFSEFLAPIEVLTAKLKTVENLDIPWLINGDNGDKVYSGLSEIERGVGYDPFYDYSAATDVLKDGYTQGYISKESYEQGVKDAKETHNYKTATYPDTLGYEQYQDVNTYEENLLKKHPDSMYKEDENAPIEDFSIAMQNIIDYWNEHGGIQNMSQADKDKLAELETLRNKKIWDNNMSVAQTSEWGGYVYDDYSQSIFDLQNKITLRGGVATDEELERLQMWETLQNKKIVDKNLPYEQTSMYGGTTYKKTPMSVSTGDTTISGYGNVRITGGSLSDVEYSGSETVEDKVSTPHLTEEQLKRLDELGYELIESEYLAKFNKAFMNFNKPLVQNNIMPELSALASSLLSEMPQTNSNVNNSSTAYNFTGDIILQEKITNGNEFVQSLGNALNRYNATHGNMRKYR